MAIKKINTDLQIEAGLLDGDGNSGTSNQILISTGTGIDWVDGSGSGIIGGPYLPLTGGTMTGNLTLSYAYPRINLYDTNNDSDYSIINNDGSFSIYDVTNNSHRLSIASGGNATFAGDVSISGGDLNVGNSSTVNSVINMLGTNNSFIEKDTGNHLYIANNVGDKDIKFRVKDDTTNIIALTIDGSEGGNATFAGDISANNLSGTNTGDQDLSGYALIDHNHDSDYVNVTGDTMTGALSINEGGATIKKTNSLSKQTVLTVQELADEGSQQTLVLKNTNNRDVGIKFETAGGINYIWQDSGDGIDDALIFSTGGENRTNDAALILHQNQEVIIPNGNVGIGTISPATALDVNGSIRVTGRTSPSSGNGLEFFYYSPADTFYLEAYDYTNSLYKNIRYAGSSHQFINGNVGIGTTSPTSKIHVIGQDATFYSNQGDQSMQIGRNANERLELYVNDSIAKITAIQDSDNDGPHDFILNRIFAGAGSNDFIVQKDGSAQLTINTDGDVGIGTTDPGAKLDVNGYVKIDSYSAGTTVAHDAGYLKIESQGKTGWGPGDEMGKIEFYVDDGSGVGRRNAASIRAVNNQGNGTSTTTFEGELAFYTSLYNTAESESMRIDSSGNVGIGATSPGDKLQVAGNAIIQDYAYIGDGVQHWGDGGTGMNFPANDTIDLATSSTSRIRITSSGNVGIGTTDPGQQLTVSGNIYSSGTVYVNTVRSATGSDIIVSRDESANIVRLGSGDADDKVHIFAGGGADPKVFIGTNGNVGIGTTSPTQKLEVVGNIRAKGDDPKIYVTSTAINGRDYSIQSSQFGTFGIYDGTTSRLSITSNGNVGIGTTSPGNLLHIHASGNNASALIIEDDARRLQLGRDMIESRSADGASVTTLYMQPNGNTSFGSTTGNLGVGVTTPRAKFHAEAGSVSYEGTYNARTTAVFENGSSGGSTISIMSQNTGYSGIFFGDTTLETRGQLQFEHSSDSFKFINGGGTERMRIIANGAVGIGTTSPGQKLDVAGNIECNSLYLNNASSLYFLPTYFGQRIKANCQGLLVQNGSTYQAVYASAFSVQSDYRLKSNVVPLDNAIDRLKQMSVHRFNWNDRLDEPKVDGFIAHELSEVIPEAVLGEKDATKEDGTPDYQGIDQSKIVPLLTAALQDAITKIEQLETRIQTLENYD